MEQISKVEVTRLLTYALNAAFLKEVIHQGRVRKLPGSEEDPNDD